MAAVRKEVAININKKINVLELGCGTGLLAENLNLEFKNIVGVDISQNMLSVAHHKQIYESLVCSDSIDFLSNNNKKFDLIFSCSMIQYFSEKQLMLLFELVNNTLKNTKSKFIFSFDIGNKNCINNKLFFEYTIDSMEKITRKYFKSLKIQKLDFGRIEHKKVVQCGLVICQKK